MRHEITIVAMVAVLVTLMVLVGGAEAGPPEALRIAWHIE